MTGHLHINVKVVSEQDRKRRSETDLSKIFTVKIKSVLARLLYYNDEIFDALHNDFKIIRNCNISTKMILYLFLYYIATEIKLLLCCI